MASSGSFEVLRSNATTASVDADAPAASAIHLIHASGRRNHFLHDVDHHSLRKDGKDNALSSSFSSSSPGTGNKQSSSSSSSSSSTTTTTGRSGNNTTLITITSSCTTAAPAAAVVSSNAVTTGRQQKICLPISSSSSSSEYLSQENGDISSPTPPPPSIPPHSCHSPAPSHNNNHISDKQMHSSSHNSHNNYNNHNHPATAPKPGTESAPVKILLDHWAEYVDSCGRRFYYNYISDESSWKPPRRRPSFHVSPPDHKFHSSLSPKNSLTSGAGSRKVRVNNHRPLNYRADSFSRADASSPTRNNRTAIPVPVPFAPSRLASGQSWKAKSMAMLPTSERMAASHSLPSTPVTANLPSGLFKEQRQRLEQEQRQRLELQLSKRPGFGMKGVAPVASAEPPKSNSISTNNNNISANNSSTSANCKTDLKSCTPAAAATKGSVAASQSSSKDKENSSGSSQRGSGEELVKPAKKKKIRERLLLFLRRRPTLETLREKGIFKDEPVFGCTLSNLCAREKATVPQFVKSCIQAIEKKDLKADGIYRVCGNLSQVQKLRFQVNQDNYSGMWKEDDVHVLTGLLKMFFRDMKEPLLPCNQFDQLIRAIALPDRKSKLERLTKLIKDLPSVNHDTLKFLLQHLLRVKELSDENRMHIQNLAIVFGPTLMWAESERSSSALIPASNSQSNGNTFADDMLKKMKSNQLVEFLLLEFDNIFNR